jgi:hypothetical protein
VFALEVHTLVPSLTGPDCGLITPIDVPVFFLGLLSYRWIGMLKPSFDFFRSSFPTFQRSSPKMVIKSSKLVFELPKHLFYLESL